MKTITLSIAAIVALGAFASVACAADFEVVATPSGDNWIYEVFNNSTNLTIIDWQVHWSTDPTEDANLCAANFDPDTGYINLPGNWEAVDDLVEPSFWIDDWFYPAETIDPGESQGGFEVEYESTAPAGPPAPAEVVPTMFQVGYLDTNDDYYRSDLMDMTGIPEPGSIAVMLIGLAGSGLLIRRKTI